MGVSFAIISGALGSIYSFFMKRSIETCKSAYYFNFVQFFVCTLITFFGGPLKTGIWHVNIYLFIAAIISGLFLGLIVIFAQKALQIGPSNLIFSIIYSAAIVPGLLLFILFGASLGFEYDIWSVLSILLVLIGLLWAGISGQQHKKKSEGGWIFFVILAFIFQALFFTAMQWRVIHLEHLDSVSIFLLPINHEEAQMQWFLPITCFTASLIQIFVIVFGKNYKPKKAEIIYGLLGGTFNGLSINFLLLAAIFAHGIEKILLFPISTVSIIILCALWGQVIYKEKVKWTAYSLCVVGILLPEIIEIINRNNY